MCDPVVFGEMVTAVVQKIGNMIAQEDVPLFLSSKHPLLGNKSPIELLWSEQQDGLRKVLDLLDGMESGSFA